MFKRFWCCEWYKVQSSILSQQVLSKIVGCDAKQEYYLAKIMIIISLIAV